MKTYFPVIIKLPNGEHLFVKQSKDLPPVFTIIKMNANEEERVR